MSDPGPFLFADRSLESQARTLLGRLPAVEGAAIRVERLAGLSDRRGRVHAGSFLRERRIAFDCTRAEFPRIFIHEVFHFVWLRLGNPARRSWERLVAGEWRAGATGELGWSAEWRKRDLDAADIEARSRRWREYCCESFCDTAAWIYGGVSRHGEFTLASARRLRRRAWFQQAIEPKRLSI